MKRGREGRRKGQKGERMEDGGRGEREEEGGRERERREREKRQRQTSGGSGDWLWLKRGAVQYRGQSVLSSYYSNVSIAFDCA